MAEISAAVEFLKFSYTDSNTDNSSGEKTFISGVNNESNFTPE